MPRTPSIVPAMLQQEFDDTPEEIESKRVRSEQIDAEIATEAVARKRKRDEEVHVLLLGQSGAGKSTLNKQFQLLCAPGTMENERAAWRGVIFMNIIRAMREVFEALGADDQLDRQSEYASNGPQVLPPISSHLLNLRYRLTPLLAMEEPLAKRLQAGYKTDQNTGESQVFLRKGWQSIPPEASETGFRREGRASLEGDDVVADVSSILQQCKEDIQRVWDLPDTQQMVRMRKIVLSEAAAKFLKDLKRISDPSWRPSDEDILFARLKTMGLETQVFDLPNKKGKQRKYRIADVGGAMSQRQAWIPYFEGSDAIIFLAPISAFDQYLAEDPSRNRIEDSMRLFRDIVNQPLLEKAHIILLLNKTDVLKQKLASGVRVNKFIPSYKDRPNTVDAVIEYFHATFKAEFEDSNTNHPNSKRTFTTFKSSVVDTVTTHQLIHNIIKKLNEEMFAQSHLGLTTNRTSTSTVSDFSDDRLKPDDAMLYSTTSRRSSSPSSSSRGKKRTDLGKKIKSALHLPSHKSKKDAE